jgi:hypothetical protein
MVLTTDGERVRIDHEDFPNRLNSALGNQFWDAVLNIVTHNEEIASRYRRLSASKK